MNLLLKSLRRARLPQTLQTLQISQLILHLLPLLRPLPRHQLLQLLPLLLPHLRPLLNLIGRGCRLRRPPQLQTMILPIQLIIPLLWIIHRRKLIIILRPILIRRRSLFDLLRLLYGLRLNPPEQLSLPLLLLLLRGILLLLILPLQQLYLLPIISRHSSMILLNLLNAVRCELLLVLRVL